MSLVWEDAVSLVPGSLICRRRTGTNDGNVVYYILLETLHYTDYSGNHITWKLFRADQRRIVHRQFKEGCGYTTARLMSYTAVGSD
jgi:hypothetical protein